MAWRAPRSSPPIIGIPAGAIAADPGQEARWLAQAMAHSSSDVPGRSGRCLGIGSGGAGGGRSGAARCAPIRLVGLGPLTPALRFLVEAWRERGASIAEIGSPPAPTGGVVRSVQASDPADGAERCAAEWCARRLDADRDARLLLVVPDLARRRI